MRNARALKKVNKATHGAFDRGLRIRVKSGYRHSTDDVMRAAGAVQYDKTRRIQANAFKGVHGGRAVRSLAAPNRAGHGLPSSHTVSRKKAGRMAGNAVRRLNRMNKKGHVQKHY